MSEILKSITESDALTRVGSGVAAVLDRVENAGARDAIIAATFGALFTLAGVKVGADIAMKQKPSEQEPK